MEFYNGPASVFLQIREGSAAIGGRMSAVDAMQFVAHMYG